MVGRHLNYINKLPWHPTRRWDKRALSDIGKIIIHQELGKGSVEAVNKYHITPSENNHLSKKGAPHFSYHFGIETDGTIIQANMFSDITWHTRGQNKNGIGIMLVGDFKGPGHDGKDEEPSYNQLLSVEYLVDFLMILFPAIHKEDLYGHNDFGKPACPGYVLMDFIEDYKT